MNYNVTIKGFSNKVYYNTTIEEILNEIKIFSNINDIISIDKISWQYDCDNTSWQRVMVV